MFKKPYQQQLLSYQYTHNQKVLKNQKLNLFGKGITLIDVIQNCNGLDMIKEIDLSHNAISQITNNIQQFSNLEILNISHNKIISFQSISQLSSLKRLRKVLLKGNPFLKEKVSSEAIPFLLSIETDVEFINDEIKSSIDQIVQRKQQIFLYSNYLRKIQIHTELSSNYQMQPPQSNVSIFPKIKKIFKHQQYEVNDLRKSFVCKILPEHFKSEEKLQVYLKAQLVSLDEKKSEIVRKIYDKEEILIKFRSSQKDKLVPKKVINKNMTNFYIKSDSPETSKYLRQNNKNTLKNQSFQKRQVSPQHRKSKIIQNSPQKNANEATPVKQNQFSEQNFINMIIKMNPLYHLLHSPLNSLKSNQKQLLIKNLTQHLKEKMKEISKYQKVNRQNKSYKTQLQQLKEHLQVLTAQFTTEQAKNIQKLKNLSKIYQTYEELIQNLAKQNEIYQVQIKALKEQMQKMMIMKEQSTLKIKQIDKQIEIQQVIREKHRNRIINRYFQLLVYKAKHFKSFKIAKEKNDKKQQAELLNFVFQELKQLTLLSKKSKKLSQQNKRSKFIQFNKYINEDLQQKNKIIHLTKYLYQKQSKLFYFLLKQKHGIKKHQNKIIRIIKTRSNGKNKIKIFGIFKDLINQKWEEDYYLKVDKYEQQIRIKRYFKVWKKFISQKQENRENNANILQVQIKKTLLQHFTSSLKYQLEFKAKKSAVGQFLAQIRKIKSYHSISKYLSTSILKRNIKISKVQLIKRHKSLFLFTQILRDKVIKSRCNRLRQRQLKKRQEQQQRISKKAQTQVKSANKLLFKNLLWKLNKNLIILILERQKKSIDLQISTNDTRRRYFLNLLSNQYLKNLKMKNKVICLNKSSFFMIKIRGFYEKLSSIVRHKNQFHRYRSFIRKVKSFYKWKFYIIESQLSTLRHKYVQTESEILDLSEMNKSILYQKAALLKQLQHQTQQIKQYMKTCEQYQFLLQSKQTKYEKLKDIYEDSVGLKHVEPSTREFKEYSADRNTKSKKTEQKITIKNKYLEEANKFIQKSYREKDSAIEQIYLKYLPQNMKAQDKISSFKKQPSLEDNKYSEFYEQKLKKIHQKESLLYKYKNTERKILNPKHQDQKYNYNYKYF